MGGDLIHFSTFIVVDVFIDVLVVVVDVFSAVFVVINIFVRFCDVVDVVVVVSIVIDAVLVTVLDMVFFIVVVVVADMLVFIVMHMDFSSCLLLLLKLSDLVILWVQLYFWILQTAPISISTIPRSPNQLNYIALPDFIQFEDSVQADYIYYNYFSMSIQVSLATLHTSCFKSV